jgi:hypothetical protein
MQNPIKIIGHCVQAGAVSSQPGKAINVIRVQQTTAPESKETNDAVFVAGVPGVIVQLSNVKPEIAAVLANGPLVEVTLRILPPA